MSGRRALSFLSLFLLVSIGAWAQSIGQEGNDPFTVGQETPLPRLVLPTPTIIHLRTPVKSACSSSSRRQLSFSSQLWSPTNPDPRPQLEQERL